MATSCGLCTEQLPLEQCVSVRTQKHSAYTQEGKNPLSVQSPKPPPTSTRLAATDILLTDTHWREHVDLWLHGWPTAHQPCA